MPTVSTVAWFVFAGVTIAMLVALGVFILDWMPLDRGDLRVGALSPRRVAALAARKRNGWVAITALIIGVAIAGSFSPDREVERIAWLVSLGAAITSALAVHFHRIVTLARNPDCVVSASLHRIVVDCEFQAPGTMRVTPHIVERLGGLEPSISAPTLASGSSELRDRA